MGVAFSVLFVVGLFVFPAPSDNKSTGQWAREGTDSGHRAAAIVGAYLVVLSVGALAFLWFAWSLRERLRADGGELTFTFGSVFRGGRRGGGHGRSEERRV